MIPTPFHGYNPDSDDRVALVRAEPSTDREKYLVVVNRGPNRANLRQTSTLGPYAEDELAAQFQSAMTELRDEGYWPGGVLALLEDLDSDSPATRARAALRLGWRRIREAVEKLLAKLPGSVDDCCSLLDALGMIGNPVAIPTVREYAERKLLSRRRSAVEALRGLGDEEGLQQARARAVERLPEKLVTYFNTTSENLEGITDAFLALDAQQQALALDTLYEIGGTMTEAVTRRILAKICFGQAFVWRAVKSVFKRSMLRHDAATFGLIAHAVEKQGRASKGTSAHVKSGYDGSTRQLPIFTRKTQNYLRRLAWRYLRELARHAPERYAHGAAQALIPYDPEDMGKYGFERCYLLHQILLGRSKRYVFDGPKMRFRLRVSKKPAAGLREEAYPDLWDAQPTAYLDLLSQARLPEVHVFALAAIKARHPLLIRAATHSQILAMLAAPHEPTVELALEELDRRFNPEKPDWSLLRQMMDDQRALARTLGQRWLRLTAHLWLPDPERIIDFLSIHQPNIRALVVELVVAFLADNPAMRQTLAERFVPLLRGQEEPAGAHAGYAAVAQEALAKEFAALVNVAELAGWIASGSDTVKVMASALLGRRPEAVTELGLERLTALAQHELVAVRAAAHALIRSALPLLRSDPSVLFVLVESDWPDTRNLAFELLRDKVDLKALGLEGLMGLLDSNRTDVQNLGKELTQKQIAALPGAELVVRLAEHPHANVRQFALDLAVQFLPEDGQSLQKLKSFCRATLLDLWPSRIVKHAAIDFLAARGVEDAAQAEVAAAILGDLVRVQNRTDAEHALEALVRIKLAFPEVPSTVELIEVDG